MLLFDSIDRYLFSRTFFFGLITSIGPSGPVKLAKKEAAAKPAAEKKPAAAKVTILMPISSSSR